MNYLKHFFYPGFIANGVGFSIKEDLVWYVLFTIFVPYAMLPLPLRWCMIAGVLSSMTHIVVISFEIYELSQDVSEKSL